LSLLDSKRISKNDYFSNYKDHFKESSSAATAASNRPNHTLQNDIIDIIRSTTYYRTSRTIVDDITDATQWEAYTQDIYPIGIADHRIYSRLGNHRITTIRIISNG
jgi:phage tail protein X